MVIKLNKFYAFILAVISIAISFTFAMQSERKTSQVSATPSVELPIVMYHHITREKDKAGDYTVTVEEFENDLKYIKSKGYTPITVSDLIDYVYSFVPLPKKPIMITFDDGFESFYVLAYPVLKRYNFKAVLSIIGYTADKYSSIDDHNIDYSNLTWSEIEEMSDSGYVEIQNHTYNLHDNTPKRRKGMSQIKGENLQDYKNVLTNDLLKLQYLIFSHTNKEAQAIAYPFGSYNKNTAEIIRALGFKSSFTCEERINYIAQNNTQSLFELGRYNRKSGISTEKFFDKIIKDG